MEKLKILFCILCWALISDARFYKKDGIVKRSPSMLTVENTVSPDSNSENTTNLESPLFAEIQNISKQQLNHALASPDDAQWELFVDDDDMKLYKMENEINGVAVDPLKAVLSVKGVSAREYIDIFYDPSLKKEWDDNSINIKLVETLAENTVIIHQVHKRIWPSAQRESLFWSQKTNVSEYHDSDAVDAFLVCNHDTNRDDVPLEDSSNVRVEMTIAMLTQTVLENGKQLGDNLTRDDVRCKVTYVAQVHPGGWVPTYALRQIYKREYPRFLRRFTKYVVDKVKTKPLQL